MAPRHCAAQGRQLRIILGEVSLCKCKTTELAELAELDELDELDELPAQRQEKDIGHPRQ
jgi:hypothetical protein